MKKVKKVKDVKEVKEVKIAKKVISLLLTLSLILAMGSGVSFAAPQAAEPLFATAISPFQQSLDDKYIDPDRVYSTDCRWWLGTASHTTDTLREEIQALYDGGYRGVELCMQNANGSGTAAPNNIYAYGSDQWAYKWKFMMNELLDLGMGVYLTSGTHWATSNVPGLDPDSQEAMQHVAMGTSAVNFGESLTALPQPSSRRNTARFIGAYAFKQSQQTTFFYYNSDNGSTNTSYVIDHDSVIDLTSLVTQGSTVWTQNLTWTPPEAGTWRIFAYWSQGTAQASSPSMNNDSYATNYFDKKGIAALREFWEEHYLDDPVLNAKILAGDVQLFMDSLEMSAGSLSGGGITFWAEDFTEDFIESKGYDIRPYLFLTAGLINSFNLVRTPYYEQRGFHELTDNLALTEKIVNDYQSFLTDKYISEMLIPLKEWLNSVGIKTRAQITYGRPFEISEPIMGVDYPEAESYNQYHQVDIYRLWSGGAKLQNKVLSQEGGTQIGYNQQPIQLQLRDAYSYYAAGGQRTIWHIWGAEYGYGNVTPWPGATHGGSGFNRMSNRNPNARDYDEFNAHLGRVQQLMQTGRSRTDVGFVHNSWFQGIRFGGERSGNSVPGNIQGMNWQFAHQGIYYRSTELQDNGYTYDYFSPKFLTADGVYFDEATKTIEQAGYKALVLYQRWLDLAAAKNILELAKKGLPVVIVDGAAQDTTFSDDKTADLAAIMAEMKTLPNVRTAAIKDSPGFDYFKPEAGAYEDEVMEKLQELGVYPYTGFVEPNRQLLTQSRVDENGNRYLYAWNYCPNNYHFKSHRDEIVTLDHGTNIKTEISIDGEFIPYSIDAWSGKSTQLANYRYENGRTIFPIDLDYDNIALFAFEIADNERLHIVSTNAESAYATQDGLVARATSSGDIITTLNNGASLKKSVTAPAPYDITDWDVTVTSWTAGALGALTRTEVLLGTSTTESKTPTVKTPINVHLPKLTTWNNITAENGYSATVGSRVSGTGYYEATFNWDASSADGAYLNFGDTLFDTMKVWINGVKVGGDISQNPTKANRTVSGTIDGQPVVNKDIYSGGVSFTKPIVDIGAYLADGENTIVIDYSSSLVNVMNTSGATSSWWGYERVIRPYGPSQAVIVPYVEQSIPFNTVFADIRADEATAPVNSPASYTVSLSNANGVGVVTLSVTADSRYLDLTGATPLNGFSILEPLSWEYVGSQLWKGTVKLYCPGFTNVEGPLDVLKISGVALDLLGDTTVTLTDFAVTGDVNGFSGAMPAFIRTTEAVTSIVPKAPVYSKYDLNHDGKIDELDLAIVVYYYLANDLETDWEDVKFDIASAKDCDVARNGRVDLADMIEVIANYCDSYDL
ncbi:MAG: hypothetical protein FWH52_00060 [Synergistaceae bacterium]|nr:hypothetical protein [Synergistaceae bacterium]